MGVRLRLITKDDTKKIVEWRNNERVRSNFVFQEVFTEEMHNNWMDTKVASGEVVQFIVETEEDGMPIGSVYFRDIEGDRGEYGMFLGEDSAIGKGYGRDITRMAHEYAFEKIGLNYIMVRIFADNPASIRSCEASGYKEYERKDVEVNGVLRPMVFMLLKKEDFKG